jgi:hypothetical protein
MSESGKKWFLWSSVVLMIISFAGILAEEMVNSLLGVNAFYISMELFVLSISNVIVILALKFEKNRWFRKICQILTYILPVCFFIVLAPAELINVSSDLGNFLLNLGIIISIAATLIYVFVLTKPESIGGLLFILSYVILTLALKQIYKQSSEQAIVFGLLLLGPGLNMFGIRILLIINKNNYLKTVSYIACLLMFFVGLEMMWLSPTGTRALLVICTFLVFLLTLIILLSVPGSGYFNWETLHKKIFKKILIPWIFILLIVSVRFIFPDLNKLFFRQKSNEYQEFYMKDYQIINKNGLEPE